MFFRNENILEKVSKGSETDKREFFKGTGYKSKRRGSFFTKWYNFYFSPIRFEKINFLEIGVGRGNSLFMWKKFFVNANIYGIEIDKTYLEYSKNKLENIEIFIGDQSNEKFLKKVCKKVEDDFDIIIDDGSHITGHQVITFEYLFKKLNPGGVYVIEDIHTSYLKGFKKGSCKNIINYLKNRVEDVNIRGKIRKYYNAYDILNQKKHKLSYYEKSIESIHFYPDICFIFKRN